MRTIIFILFSVLCASSAFADGLEKLEQKMEALQDEILSGSTDEVRKEASLEMRSLLLKAFDEEGVFEYPFEKVFRMAISTSPDGAFRLFNWSEPHLNGTHSYYAFILLPQKGEYIELQDNDDLKVESERYALTPDAWYGALYYEIYPVDEKREKYYVLMGWDGNDALSNKKVLDVLLLDKKGEVSFGKPVFQTTDGMAYRRVFEYAKQARMNLRYMEMKDAIVFDRLEPEQPGLTGQYAFYIPSTAYNGYKLNKEGTWDLIEFLDMSRPKSEESGAQFNFPDKVKFERLENNVNPITGK